MYIDTRSSSTMTEIEHYLKPMARQCINSRLDYRQISEIFKTVLVSIAESEFTIAGKSQTDSRISLLTGVHRKDVRRLLSQVQNKTLSRQHGLITQIITVWLETPELISKDGTPKPIPRHPQKGYVTSFTELAETLTRDIHVRALWDECINSGIVSLTDDGMVHLLATNDIWQTRICWSNGKKRHNAETCLHQTC